MEQQHQAREDKKRKLVNATIAATEQVQKLCGGPCKSSEAVAGMLAQCRTETQRRELLVSQIDYFKTINRGVVKGTLFYKTKAGTNLTNEQLQDNLQVIISQLCKQNKEVDPHSENDPSSSSDKELCRKQLRIKIMSKLKPIKRKLQFPEDRIVKKRIRHKFLPVGGKKLISYTGTVLRKSSETDLEELMEEVDRELLDQGYTFYTVVYDKDEHLYTYPLQKEWEDNCLDKL